jgi:Flp pilus assembly protein TadD
MNLLLAAALAAATPPSTPAPPTAALAQLSLAEASHALAAGRLDQARAMIATAVAAGATGEQVDRLLADLAFIAGDNVRALAGYATLFAAHPDNALLAERAGISALKLGDTVRAIAYLDHATAKASLWRAWNARGVAADRMNDWAAADAAYARAAAIAPDQGQIANNRGWSLILRGQWDEALEALEQAAALDPKSPRIANNLELAREALKDGLPKRAPGENDQSWSARLNDAGVAAAARGERGRAIAAFAQAIETRTAWFGRAAENLAAIQAAQ